jgi:hypothetical protein
MSKFYALLIFVALSACKPSATIVPADYIEVAPPKHPKIALYINQYKSGTDEGATLHPNLSIWNPKLKGKFGISTNQERQPPYSATLEYLGRKSDHDVYSVTISIPENGQFKKLTKEFSFSGADIELFRDDLYRIGLRPYLEN